MHTQLANQREAVLAAGFFAGEGCVYISRSKNRSHSLTVSIGNTDKVWIDWLQDNFNGSIYSEQPKKLSKKVIYRWKLFGSQCVPFLQAIQPFLIGEKAPQVNLALEFQKTHGEKSIVERDEVCVKLQQLKRAPAETNRENTEPIGEVIVQS